MCAANILSSFTRAHTCTVHIAYSTHIYTYNIVYIKKELKTKENVKTNIYLYISLSLISHFSLFLFLSLSLAQ